MFLRRSALRSSGCSDSRGHRRSVKQCAGGNLFGGLQRLLGSDAPKAPTTGTQPKPPAAAEYPPYQVLQRGAVYDLRLYAPFQVVEMSYERRDEGYLALGGYMDGENSEGARFVFTQPVVMSYEAGGSKSMQWYIGSRRPANSKNTDTAAAAPSSSKPSSSSPAAAGASLPPAAHPLPTNAAVRLGVAGGDLVAVHKFEGYITPETAAAARATLVRALEQDGLDLAPEDRSGRFRVAQYGPVHSLAPRLNEMMLGVQVERDTDNGNSSSTEDSTTE